jgi:hypothetical protein
VQTKNRRITLAFFQIPEFIFSDQPIYVARKRRVAAQRTWMPKSYCPADARWPSFQATSYSPHAALAEFAVQEYSAFS